MKKAMGESGLNKILNLIKGMFSTKQDRIYGNPGALAGFDKAGKLNMINTVIAKVTFNNGIRVNTDSISNPEDATSKRYVDERFDTLIKELAEIKQLLEDIDNRI